MRLGHDLFAIINSLVVDEDVLAALSQASALTNICDIRTTLGQILASEREIRLSLEQQRRVLFDAHKRIHAVTKGLEKPTS